MKKTTFFILLVSVFSFMFFPFMSQGQTNYEDIIYLKNGGIMHGMIIEQVPNVSIKIQTADRNVFVYSITEIEKITKEEVKVQTNSTSTSKPGIGNIKQKGVTCIIEMCFDRFDFEENEFSLNTGFTTSVGYLFNPYFNIGIGTGIEINPDETLLPLFVDLRYNVLKKAATPFISFKAGYSFGMGGSVYDHKGGLLLNPNLGVKFFVSPNVAMNFSMGFKYQAIDYYYYGDKNEHKFFNFSMGVTI